MKVLLLPTDPNDNRNVMLEIRAGTGGDEAAIWAGDLLGVYRKYASEQARRARGGGGGCSTTSPQVLQFRYASYVCCLWVGSCHAEVSR